MPEDAARRPRCVTVALGLVIAAYAVGTVTFVTQRVAAYAAGQLPLGGLVLAGLVLFVLYGGLIAALAYRRRWAWWVWMVLFILGLPGLWSDLDHSLGQGLFSEARYLLVTALDVAAVVLLLLRPSRRWYGVGRKPGERRP